MKNTTTPKEISEILDKVESESENFSDKLISVLGESFVNNYNHYFYSDLNIQHFISDFSISDFFCKKSNNFNIKPIFEYLQIETETNRSQNKNRNMLGIVRFNDIWGGTKIDVEVSCKKESVPPEFEKINDKTFDYVLDIEFFEKIPIRNDSKNHELIALDGIKEYEQGILTQNDIDDLGGLMALRDKEKIHIKLLVAKYKESIPLYIGVGNQEPFNLPVSKNGKKYGKNRFYKFDLLNKIEIKSNISYSDLEEISEFIAPDESISGKKYADCCKNGIICFQESTGKWEKADIDYDYLDINIDSIDKPGMDFLTEKLFFIFPDFYEYSLVFYSPMRNLLKYGMDKTILFLHEKKILGEGWCYKLNVASDLYLNGLYLDFRLKPSLLLLSLLIKRDNLELFKNYIDDSSHYQNPHPLSCFGDCYQ